jgi:hypothetical protein
MNRLLVLYNRNEYVKVCFDIVKGFSVLSNFIGKMRVTRDLQKRDELISIYSDIFENSNYASYFLYEIERVIKPHYSRWSGVEHKLSVGNSSYHILLKIGDNDMLFLDQIYEGRLTGLLRMYKNMFSIIDAPEHELSDEALSKREEMIHTVSKQMTLFLNSIDRRQDIQTREKLEAEIIQNIPFDGFYHLTHISNLKNIIEKGILSRNKLDEEGGLLCDISNSSIQNKRRRPEAIYGRMIHDYVPLYINPKNPFLGSSKVRNSADELVLIEVYPHILVQLEKTLFSDGNAAETNTNFFNKKDELEKVNWTLLQNGKWNEDESKRMMCSEILIPDFIHRSYIQKIYMKSIIKIEEIMKAHPNSSGIELVVNSNLFKLENESY